MINFLAIPLCLICALTSANAQILWLNTKTPYQPQQRSYTPVPDGYKAVFINYTGRHGARFQTSSEKEVLVTDVFQQADNKSELTQTGKLVYQKIILLQAIEKDKYGNITRLGEKEQHDIAARMQKQFPDIFTNAMLRVEMTDKPRTQQSAKAFLSGLHGYDTSELQSVIFPASSDSILRFYDLSKPYKNYLAGNAVTLHTDSLLNDSRTIKAANDVCKNLFTKDFVSQLKSGAITSEVKDKNKTVTAVNFSLALYDIYAAMFSAKDELQEQNKDAITTVAKSFPKQALLWFDAVTSASDFYEKGPADNAEGIQVTIAAPLLRDLINTTDSAIQLKKYSAVLRFTHAEAISPLAGLLGIPAASKASSSVFTFSHYWQASDIIPMSANVQWILYSNGKNLLLKVLLNEREVSLSVATQSYPYYNWNDIKLYYQNKLSSLSKN